MDDLGDMIMLDRARERWGPHPMDWPVPPYRRPFWWRFTARRKLADLEAVFGRLNDAALGIWWTELHKGQSAYEDAGGFLLRCYEAMIGGEVAAPYTYADATADLMEDRHA